MKPDRLARSLFMRAAASPGRRRAQRRAAELRRRLRGAPHRVEYFHQVDDPYSHLAAQALAPLAERYAIVLEPHLVAAPDERAAPERELLTAFARRDAADVAAHFGTRFADPGAQPAPERIWLAQRILAGALGSAHFGALATRVGEALWADAATALEAIAAEAGSADEHDTRRRIEAGSERRARLGHYLGATFHYGGEWYWGVDRLGHLEERLRELSAVRVEQATPLFPPPPETCNARGASGVILEFFLSLRSPYTYIVMPRVFDLARRTGVRLVLRPVLPMVMRGLPVPRQKGAYILMDVAREAERLGIPFGKIVDPVGRPVERAYSLFAWARERDEATALLLGFARAAFAEGTDTGTDAGIRRVIERAGLSFAEARHVLDNEEWRKEFEENRRAMYAAGLWGVPSFRVRGPAGTPDHATWGQDRLFRVAQEIERRAAG